MLWLSKSKRDYKVFSQNMVIQSIFDSTSTELFFKILVSQCGIHLPKYISVIAGEYRPWRKTSTSKEKACNLDFSCVN